MANHVGADEAMRAALAHHQAGRLAEAEAIYRNVLQAVPAHADALHLLGVVAHQSGRQDAAAALIRRAINRRPDAAPFHFNLGEVLLAQGRTGDAVASYRRAVELEPQHASHHCALGSALLSAGQWAEAVEFCRRASAMQPDLAAAHYGEGSALLALGELETARAALERAVTVAPRWAQAQCNLGTALQRLRDAEGAERAFRAVLAIQPDVKASNNLGNLLLAQFEFHAAIECFRLALSLDGSLHETHSNLLLALNYDPRITPGELFAEHRAWAQEHASGLPRFSDHPNERDPNRPLRIGFVSADLRQHPVGFFMEPLLENLDRQSFSVSCYSNNPREDELSARLRRHAHRWRDVSRMTDGELCETVRSDQIDILIDLSGHTAGNRLLAFARKPAPVQVSYLGYPNTTGLAEIDYVIGLPDLDGQVSERLVQLPGSLVCYRPPMQCPDVEARPSAQARNGEITFGCLNNPAKVSDEMLSCWSEIIQAVPRSRLLLHADPGKHLQRVSRLLSQRGVEPQRIEFIGRQSAAAYFATYNRIDIALDPFPYNGGTTTCDALWMGCPVVTLSGGLPASRIGLYLLSVVGLSELAGDSRERYVQIAAELARDPTRLGELRRTMRDRMIASPLMDGPRVAREFARALQTMWRQWCTECESPAH